MTWLHDTLGALPGPVLDPRCERAVRLARGLVAEEHAHHGVAAVGHEQDTPLFDQMKAGKFEVNEELACDMHEELVSYAASRGYRQYEVANFARDAAENRAAAIVEKLFEPAQIDACRERHQDDGERHRKTTPRAGPLACAGAA